MNSRESLSKMNTYENAEKFLRSQGIPYSKEVVYALVEYANRVMEEAMPVAFDAGVLLANPATMGYTDFNSWIKTIQ